MPVDGSWWMAAVHEKNWLTRGSLSSKAGLRHCLPGFMIISPYSVLRLASADLCTMLKPTNGEHPV